MNEKLTISRAANSDQPSWDQYVLKHPKGLAYQLSAWSRAVEEAYRFKSFCLLAKSGGRIQGVFPLIQWQLPFFARELVSLPFCDAGGPLADNPGTELSLLKHAIEVTGFTRSTKLAVRSAYPFADLNPDLTINHQKVRMILILPNDSDKLLASLKAKVRSQIKKACKNGLSSVIGSVSLLDDFYTVFSENMRDLGSPVHSKKWIYAILKAYGNRAHISVVYMPDGQPAAAGIILCHPKLVSIPWASSLRRFNTSNPNMLLYWTFLKFASDNQYPAFDFGRSTPEEGTFRFKKQWGAKPHCLHWADFNSSFHQTIRHQQPVVVPQTSGNGKLRSIAEAVIQKMPVSVFIAFGNITRKYVTL